MNLFALFHLLRTYLTQQPIKKSTWRTLLASQRLLTVLWGMNVQAVLPKAFGTVGSRFLIPGKALTPTPHITTFNSPHLRLGLSRSRSKHNSSPCTKPTVFPYRSVQTPSPNSPTIFIASRKLSRRQTRHRSPRHTQLPLRPSYRHLPLL